MERSSSDHQLPKQQQNSSSLLSPPQEPKLESNINILADSPRNVDRLKRDEWSEGAVSTLLQAYESKWTLRNRAKLKGQDWEDVAKHVSGRENGSKPAKTQTQCKNKIESMKKRYRSESAAVDGSSWPLYSRLDLLLRGNGGGTPSGSAAVHSNVPTPLVVPELPPLEKPKPPVQASAPPPPPPPPLVLEVPPVQGTAAQNSHGSNGGGNNWLAKEGDHGNNNNVAKLTNHAAEKNPAVMDEDTESSSPAIYSNTGKEKPSTKPPNSKMKTKKLKRARDDHDQETNNYYMIGESIRWVAEVVLRSEQARMETMREIERMRAEAEAKRGEIDLRRTEIIANTQLQIAKLFARGSLDH